MAKVRLNCKNCGHFFWVLPYRKNSAKYCSKECFDKYREMKITLICHNCDEEFERIPSDNRYELSFCNEDCFHEHKRKEKTYRNCLCCSEEFHTTEWALEQGWGKFCSHSCATKHLRREGVIVNPKLYPKTHKLRARVSKNRQVTNLDDCYVASAMGESVDDLPDSIIQAKRVQIMAYRQANNNLKITPELCQNVNLPLTT